jgi:hypothetical protein
MNFCSKLECSVEYAGKLGRDKHSTLMQKFVNYGQKNFITLSPGVKVTKLFTDIIYE